MSSELDWGTTTHHVVGSPVLPEVERVRQQHPQRRRHRVAAVVTLTSVLVLVLGVVAFVRFGLGGTAEPLSDCHLATCTGTPGQADATITRAGVAERARQWLGNENVPYSMTDGHAGPGGWGWFRRDCSGFVSMALHLDDDQGGPTTVTLADDLVPIHDRDLRPYDLIGRLGPGTGGENGHVQLFLGWANAQHTRVRVAEQGGLHFISAYPHTAVYAWPETLNDGARLTAYRYRNIAG